jgi:predicted RNA binding protein YcfA (HicA-like mRNA interferase family)
MKLPRISGQKVLNALSKAGFKEVHIRGSHHYLFHAVKDRIVTVPVPIYKKSSKNIIRTGKNHQNQLLQV